ncbi:MAG TPA: hypothetical protein ENJ28_04035 [Gammaproteobacteria bacterium]|nr:hypothetical protein [Gammaproteobacteria bacterium]
MSLIIVKNILKPGKICLMTYLCLLPWLVFSADSHDITPSFIKIITNPYEQYNDVNPGWSPLGTYISFERYDMHSHNIVLSDLEGNVLKNVLAQGKPLSEMDLLFSEEEQVISYNTGISWSKNEKQYVFVSSGKSNNFDLFLGKIDSDKTRRLTFHPLKDNQAQWSPSNDDILFISAREENAGLYLINAVSGKVKRLLDHKYDALYPVWSPDGKRVAVMIGQNSTYQIYVINDIAQPELSLQKISGKYIHNIRPSWSPDGSKLSYFSFEYPNRWDINIVDLVNENPVEITIASDVIQNSSRGPTWLPDSTSIAYIKNETDRYNPIYIVDTSVNQHKLFLTNTKMNLDLSCSPTGILAFQSQDRQWSRIYIAGIPGFKG